MINKSRESFLYATSKQFNDLYNLLNGIVKAEVVSALALSEGNKQQLVSALEKELNKRVILNAKVNADLIGGFVLTVGDKQFDTTIAKQLNELKKNFMSNDFVAQL
ncbi:ATP synthase subunit delta [compost metagenome]